MKYTEEPHLAITTGGTGGHFFPALCIAREYRARVGPVTMIISGQNSQKYLDIAGRHGVEAVAQYAPPPPKTIFSLAAFPFRLTTAVFRAWKLLKDRRIDLLLGMGGFPSLPPGLAAILRRKPLFLHEGNAVLGRANRFLQRYSRKIMLSLPLNDNSAVKAPVCHTGLPIRPELLRAKENTNRKVDPDLCRHTGLSSSLPTLLVFGGSQGARFLNQLTAAFCQLPETVASAAHFQLIHFTGDPDATDAVRQLCRQADIKHWVDTWCDQMELAYRAADIILCRAGAATITEAAWFEKSVILTPLPFAADDHQTVNARVLEQRNAALHWPQHETTPQRLLAAVKCLIAEPDTWRRRGSNLAAFANPHAAEKTVIVMSKEYHQR